jgi:hypothetical protein
MPSFKAALCHPDKRCYARDKCKKCYEAAGPYPVRVKRVPTCHPNRAHAAHGLCRECYGRSRYSPKGPPVRVAECHPKRPHLAKGKCKVCYYRDRYKVPEIGDRIRAYQKEYRKLA